MYKLSAETKETINNTLMRKIGMTYDEYEKLDVYEQQEIIKKARLKHAKDKKEKISRVMIGYGEHSCFVKVPKGKKIMTRYGTIVAAGLTREEHNINKKMNETKESKKQKTLFKRKLV